MSAFRHSPILVLLIKSKFLPIYKYGREHALLFLEISVDIIPMYWYNYPNLGYIFYPNLGYIFCPNLGYIFYPNLGYIFYPNLGCDELLMVQPNSTAIRSRPQAPSSVTSDVHSYRQRLPHAPPHPRRPREAWTRG